MPDTPDTTERTVEIIAKALIDNMGSFSGAIVAAEHARDMNVVERTFWTLVIRSVERQMYDYWEDS